MRLQFNFKGLAVIDTFSQRLCGDILSGSLYLLSAEVTEELAEIIVHELLLVKIFVHLFRCIRKNGKIKFRIVSKPSYRQTVPIGFLYLYYLCVCVRAVLCRSCIRMIEFIRARRKNSESRSILTVNIRLSRTSAIP